MKHPTTGKAAPCLSYLVSFYRMGDCGLTINLLLGTLLVFCNINF